VIRPVMCSNEHQTKGCRCSLGCNGFTGNSNVIGLKAFIARSPCGFPLHVKDESGWTGLSCGYCKFCCLWCLEGDALWRLAEHCLSECRISQFVDKCYCVFDPTAVHKPKGCVEKPESSQCQRMCERLPQFGVKSRNVFVWSRKALIRWPRVAQSLCSRWGP